MAIYTGKLELSDEYREALDPYLSKLVDSSIAAHAGRDGDLADNDDLLELVEMEGLPSPYEGSCTLNDILPLEQFITLYSQIMPPLYRDTLVTVQADNADEKEGAHKTEVWLANDWQRSGYYFAKSMQFYNALRDKAGILYGGYCDRTINRRVRMYAEVDEAGKFKYWNEERREPDDLVDQKHRKDGTEYAPIWVTKEEVERKAEYRAVNQINFYLIPPDAPSIEDADLSVERLLLTKNKLLEGITRYEYEEDAVMELIEKGETHEGAASSYRVRSGVGQASVSDNRNRENEIAGVEPMMVEDTGVYECYLLCGLLPKLWQHDTSEVEALLPKDLWNTHVVLMICPAHHIVFMAKPSPFPGWKPYTSVSLIEKPNRPYGRGLMDIVEPLARETTHFLRQAYNGLEIEMMPEYAIDDESWDRNKNRQRFPGKVWRLSAGGTLTAIPSSGVSRLGWEPIHDCRMRANTLVGAQGVGEIQTKVRKEAEIVSAQTRADSKGQLYQHFLYRSVPDEASRRVEMELLFNPDYAGKVDTEDEGTLEITAADLAGDFTYSVASIGEDSSPEARSRKAAAILSIQRGYYETVERFPMDAESIWNGHRNALLAERVREPETLIGPKPASRKELEAKQASLPAPPPPGSGGAIPGGGTPLAPMGMNGNGAGAIAAPVGLPSI